MDDVPTAPEALRLRARHLDDVAAQLEGSLAMKVHLRAGDTTWRGGVAETCRDELHEVARLLAFTAQSLRVDAERCRRAAVLIEVPP